MDLSRISRRTWLRMTLALAGFIIAVFFLDKLYKRYQSYEGLVVQKSTIKAYARRYSWEVHFARIQTPDGKRVKADADGSPRVTTWSSREGTSALRW
jgi:hypothetical protein